MYKLPQSYWGFLLLGYLQLGQIIQIFGIIVVIDD